MREQTTWSEKNLELRHLVTGSLQTYKSTLKYKKRRESISTKKQIKSQFITRKENELFQSKKESPSIFR